MDKPTFVWYNGEMLDVTVVSETETHFIVKTENGKTLYIKKEKP